MITEIEYTKPVVLSHQPIQFETCQSWNSSSKGVYGNSNGNDGINYSAPGNNGNGLGGGNISEQCKPRKN